MLKNGVWHFCEEGDGGCQASAVCTLRRATSDDEPIPAPANAHDDFTDHPHDSSRDTDVPRYRIYSEWVVEGPDCPSFIGTFACDTPYQPNITANQCE